MKIVGKTYYVHKSNVNELISYIRTKNDGKAADIMVALDEIKEKFDWSYEVIKYDLPKHRITFIQSPDWNTANEPVVGDGMMLNMLGTWEWKLIKGRKTNPQIYHSKWMFVDQSFYDGFDVIEAYRRTKAWQFIPNLDKKRIGNQDYWFSILDTNGIER